MFRCAITCQPITRKLQLLFSLESKTAQTHAFSNHHDSTPKVQHFFIVVLLLLFFFIHQSFSLSLCRLFFNSCACFFFQLPSFINYNPPLVQSSCLPPLFCVLICAFFILLSLFFLFIIYGSAVGVMFKQLLLHTLTFRCSTN